MNDVEALKEEQLNKDLDLLLNKYGIEYAYKIKSLLNTKIERRKYELSLIKNDIENKIKNSPNSNWNELYELNNKRIIRNI